MTVETSRTSRSSHETIIGHYARLLELTRELGAAMTREDYPLVSDLGGKRQTIFDIIKHWGNDLPIEVMGIMRQIREAEDACMQTADRLKQALAGNLKVHQTKRRIAETYGING